MNTHVNGTMREYAVKHMYEYRGLSRDEFLDSFRGSKKKLTREFLLDKFTSAKKSHDSNY